MIQQQPVYTGWAQYHYLKRIGSCLACKGRGYLLEMSNDGEDIEICPYCPVEPEVHPVRSA